MLTSQLCQCTEMYCFYDVVHSKKNTVHCKNPFAKKAIAAGSNLVCRKEHYGCYKKVRYTTVYIGT